MCVRSPLLPLALALGVACQAPGPPGYDGIAEDRPSGSAAIDTVGLVAAFDMETVTTDGRLRDFGPYGLHGTIEGTTVVAGRAGRARRFGSVDDRVDLPESGRFDLPGPLTVAAWIRVTEGARHQHAFVCDDAWAFWVTPADRYRLGSTRGNGIDTQDGRLQVGAWQSVVMSVLVRRGDSMTARDVRVWVDGEPAVGPVGPVWNSGPLYPDDACYIGFESHQGNEAHQELPFYGEIDELLLYRRGWTDAEARAHARAGPARR